MRFSRHDVHGLTHESKRKELTPEQNAKVMSKNSAATIAQSGGVKALIIK